MGGQRREGIRGAAGAARAARWPPPSAVLDRLIEQATVDAYDDDERFTGMLWMLHESLKVPFEVEVLGVSATVERVGATKAGEIVAICRRGKARQSISVLELRLPRKRPEGAEWIEAYRRMASGG